MATDGIKDLELLANHLAHMGDMKELGEVIDQIGKNTRRSNAARIKANDQPDGRAMPKRRPRSEQDKGNAHIAFVYKNPVTGVTLVRNLKNWHDFGWYIKGYDRTRGAIRSFRRDRILSFISIDKSKVIVRKAPQKMFKNIIKAKWFKLRTTDSSATLEFAGVAGTVAAIHHYGEKDKPHPRAKEVRYPERQLLGISHQDEKDIEDILIDHLTRDL